MWPGWQARRRSDLFSGNAPPRDVQGLSHLGLAQMPDLRPAYLGEVLGADVERMLVAWFLHSRSVIGWTSSPMSEFELHLRCCCFRWWSRGGVEAVSDTLRW